MTGPYSRELADRQVYPGRRQCKVKGSSVVQTEGALEEDKLETDFLLHGTAFP